MFNQQKSLKNQNNQTINKMYCNNCGKQGHLYNQCSFPIISYGVIAFRYNPIKKEIEYLMIRRKDSFGYIDFIRGKYSPLNPHQIQKSIDQMSREEKKNLKEYSNFNELWKHLWCELDIKEDTYSQEKGMSSRKFDVLKKGYLIQNQQYSLDYYVQNSQTCWEETEWEFPKGRRNIGERDLECGLREFEEETGYSKNQLYVLDNVLPFEEMFMGSNYKSYKNKYYLCLMPFSCQATRPFQQTEVSKIEWKTLNQCLSSIRPYHLEKQQIILHISELLRDFKLYT